MDHCKKVCEQSVWQSILPRLQCLCIRKDVNLIKIDLLSLILSFPTVVQPIIPIINQQIFFISTRYRRMVIMPSCINKIIGHFLGHFNCIAIVRNVFISGPFKSILLRVPGIIALYVKSFPCFVLKIYSTRKGV